MYYTTMATHLALDPILLCLPATAMMFANIIDSTNNTAKTARAFIRHNWQATHQYFIVQTRRYVTRRVVVVVVLLFICRACKATHDHIMHTN